MSGEVLSASKRLKADISRDMLTFNGTTSAVPALQLFRSILSEKVSKKFAEVKKISQA
jgi:hypothetical protein